MSHAGPGLISPRLLAYLNAVAEGLPQAVCEERCRALTILEHQTAYPLLEVIYAARLAGMRKERRLNEAKEVRE